MNNKRTILGAATLLLAVGAATTLADELHDELDKQYRSMFSHEPTRFKLEDCINMKRNLAEGNTFSTEPNEMLKQLKAFEGKAEGPLQRHFAARLISYADCMNCDGVRADEFLAIITICKDVDGLERLINFVDYFGRRKFLICSRNILNLHKERKLWPEGWFYTLARLVAFFRFDLKTDVSRISDAMMYEHTRMVKDSFKFFEEPCIFFRNKVFPGLSIFNVARAMGFVNERELGAEFPRLNKFVLFCVRYLNKLNEEAPQQIRLKFQAQ